jgi:hypothetical protein
MSIDKVLFVIVLIGGVSSLFLSSVGFYDNTHMANSFHMVIGILQLVCSIMILVKRDVGFVIGILTYSFSVIYSFSFLIVRKELLAFPGLILSSLMVFFFIYYK